MIPRHTEEALSRYVNHGLEPGSFLKAVLTNNLFRAVECADIDNKFALANIVEHIYNKFPIISHGSEENYYNWIESKRSVDNLKKSAII
jgi:hypothetical protein